MAKQERNNREKHEQKRHVKKRNKRHRERDRTDEGPYQKSRVRTHSMLWGFDRQMGFGGVRAEHFKPEDVGL